jgi:hypothetical protein
MRCLLCLLALLVAVPVVAQDSPLFPRFSVIGGAYSGRFDTTVRIDPDATEGAGTQVGFERDLGLERMKQLQQFRVQWRPLARHELAATYFASSRSGFRQIDRDIVFRNQSYPVSALVTTGFDLDYASLTYTYWARRSDRDGFGITLGAAALSLDASVIAQRADLTITASQSAKTDVPVALGGVQGRLAFTTKLLGEASVSALPRVTIEGYTGRAVTANARLEYRPVRWLGIGGAYNYFRLDVDVAQSDLTGAIGMRVQGPEAYVRLAF